MDTVKTYAGFFGVAFLAALAVLVSASAHNRLVFPAQLAAHEQLQADMLAACVLPPAQFDAVAAKAIQSNWSVWHRHERQRDSLLGDALLPDGWENVRYIVIPNEQDCARIASR